MRIDCRTCEHYYITWEKSMPHGCRAMGFKSFQLPSTVVRSTTPATGCLAYKERKKRSPRPIDKE